MLSEMQDLFDKNVLPEALEESDPELLLSFYQLFLDHTLPAWQDATEAANEKQWGRLRTVAHSLKSSSMGVGATAIGRKMAELERLIDEGSEPAAVIIEQATEIITQTSAVLLEYIAFLQTQASQEQ
jgi:HPt (histidine-containing phosphotransfer) domain-containing protein